MLLVTRSLDRLERLDALVQSSLLTTELALAGEVSCGVSSLCHACTLPHFLRLVKGFDAFDFLAIGRTIRSTDGTECLDVVRGSLLTEERGWKPAVVAGSVVVRPAEGDFHQVVANSFRFHV